MILKIGSHVSFRSPDYLLGSANETIKNNANAMMIFLGPPQSSRRIDITKYKKNEFLKKFKNKILQENIVIHGPYIINLASLDIAKNEFAINFMIAEILKMNYIGAKYFVIHPGHYTKFSKDDSIQQLIKSLKKIFQKTPQNIEILIENMSGKGTELGTNLKEIKFIIDSVNSSQLKICLDTCHLWDSGINIKNFNAFILKLKNYKLLNLVKVIHLNDSKNDLNSKKDRHENINKGKIGLETIKKFVHAKEFENAIKILETPLINGKSIHDQEIEILK